MKLIIGVNRKVSANFASDGASCGLELEVDQALLDQPSVLADKIRGAFGIAESAVEDQLQRGADPPPIEIDDTLRPGDRGYTAPAAPPRQAPPQRDRAAYGRPPADDPPTTGRQFAGWLTKQGPDCHQRVRDLIRAWNLPGRYVTWHDDDVRAVVHELLSNPTQEQIWPGASNAAGRNGYHR
jgi:hypothetical protein